MLIFYDNIDILGVDFMMVDPIYTLTINGNFLGILIASVMVGAFTLLSILYYIYIDKDQLLFYLIGFFLFLELSLLIRNYLLVVEISDVPLYKEILYEDILIFLEYGMVLSILFCTMHILQNKHLIVKAGAILITPIFYILGINSPILVSILFYIYLSFVLLYGIFFTVYEIVSRSAKKYIWYVGLYFSFFLYFIISHYNSLGILSVGVLSWSLPLFFVLVAVSIFLLRYKKVIEEKEYLFESLTHDSLTKLFSRSYFIESLNNSKDGAIVFIDFNKFKIVNDKYGHLVGDKLLVDFSKYLINKIAEDFIPCRYGGDEFVILTKNDKSKNEYIKELIDSLISSYKQILKENCINEEEVGISIGVSTFETYKGHDALLDADSAMYEAKKTENYSVIFNSRGVTA